jgi:hypothetical protein
MTWLRDIRWPVTTAVLDGEAVADEGTKGFRRCSRRATRWVTGGSAARIVGASRAVRDCLS